MAAREDRGPPPDPDQWTERGHQQVQGDHPHPARAAGEVAPDPVGLRLRRSSPAETRQTRRAPPLPVRRTYLPPYSPLKSLPHRRRCPALRRKAGTRGQRERFGPRLG